MVQNCMNLFLINSLYASEFSQCNMEVPVATDTTQLFQRSGYTTPPGMVVELGNKSSNPLPR